MQYYSAAQEGIPGLDGGAHIFEIADPQAAAVKGAVRRGKGSEGKGKAPIYRSESELEGRRSHKTGTGKIKAGRGAFKTSLEERVAAGENRRDKG